MEYEILIRFLLAALWGGIVGAEREYRSKSAGFRTMIMISLGACLFTMMSVWIGEGSNPDRIASNIVTGIGFLGAGVIFRGENRINGITTAATIWAVAAVGMSIGAGKYFAAGSASVLILIVLALLPWCENLIDRLNQTKTYTITIDLSKTEKKNIEQLLRDCSLSVKLTKESRDEKQLSLTWQAQGRAKDHSAFINALHNESRISRFEYY